MRLKPFFTYYGGKWRIAPRYPSPAHHRIIEPFAGSAGYSLVYPEHRVRLYDANPVIVGLWSYLIGVTEAEVMALPSSVEHVDALSIPQEAKWLIGFWLNKGVSMPCKQPSAWMKTGESTGRFNTYWGDGVKARIASQLHAIRHWRVWEAEYEQVPDLKATWFVDPPYVGPAGRYYPSRVSDYEHLGEWCRGLQGQVIVCEAHGADWLPFSPFHDAKANNGIGRTKVSREVVYIGGS